MDQRYLINSPLMFLRRLSILSFRQNQHSLFYVKTSASPNDISSFFRNEKRSFERKHPLKHVSTSKIPLTFQLEGDFPLFNLFIKMVKPQFVILVSVLLALSISQIVPLSQYTTPQAASTLGPEYNDPNFIKLIDNYFGCKTWTDGECVECSKGYVFNTNGICCEVDEYCEQFNSAAGICEVCYTGYSVSSNGSCTVTPAHPSNVGCATWKKGACEACSVKYYFNHDHVCTAVSDSCREWNANGECTSCYYGYEVLNGTCVPTDAPLTTNVKSNPLCANWNSSVCVACAHRAYFDVSGVCNAVSDHCNTWDRLNGGCLSCYSGYDLVNGSCVDSPSNTAAPADSGCQTWVNGVCKACSTNWVFNPKGACTPVSDLCKTSDNAGDCLSCYAGYDLTNGSCLYSPSNNAKPTDGGCKVWDWKNSVCLECSTNWVFNSNSICIPVSDQCRTSDKAGACTNCYKGYDLQNGACVYSPSNDAPLADAGCKIWDWKNNVCQTCSEGWYFSNGVCSTVSSLCQTHDTATGACLSCYQGYDLVNGSCVFSPSNNASPADLGCKTWANGVCKECSAYFAFNSNGVCTAVSDQCKTYSGLSCTSCYNGYVLVNDSCIFSPLNSLHPTDAGCSLWDWNSQTCLTCSNYWYFSNGVCAPVSSLCKTYDSKSGACLTCYLGYDLADGSCVLSDKNSKPSDAGCATWDWKQQTCLKCSPYWVPINGTCHSVSSYCKTYDDTGACTSCFSGYNLSNGACSVVNTLCKTQDANGACLTCYSGYALYGGKCVSTSSLANIALYYAACCPEKLAQLKAEGRIPQ